MEDRLEKGNEGEEDGAFTQICLSFLSLMFSFFLNGCIFPFYELISFSRVLDVV